MFCVGLTGNIASGKSTVAAFFKTKGIQVLDADEIARELTTIKSAAYGHILKHFGDQILLPHGELNRQALRQIIFNEPNERLWLEQLLHPLIRQRIKTLIDTSESPYCVIEIPLLKSKKDYPYLNRILVVLAEHGQQIKRVIRRDHCSREQARAILATQPRDTERKKSADDILINNGSLAELQGQVTQLHQRYLQMAANKSVI